MRKTPFFCARSGILEGVANRPSRRGESPYKLPFSTQPNYMGQPTRAEDIADPNVAMERGRAEESANLNKEFEIAVPMEWAPGPWNGPPPWLDPVVSRERFDLLLAPSLRSLLLPNRKGRFIHSRLEYRAISVWNFRRGYSLTPEKSIRYSGFCLPTRVRASRVFTTLDVISSYHRYLFCAAFQVSPRCGEWGAPAQYILSDARNMISLPNMMREVGFEWIRVHFFTL